MDSAAAPSTTPYDEPTLLRSMAALHGARRTPPGLRPALVTHLLDAGLVAYTDVGWTITAAGYRKLAAAGRSRPDAERQPGIVLREGPT